MNPSVLQCVLYFLSCGVFGLGWSGSSYPHTTYIHCKLYNLKTRALDCFGGELCKYLSLFWNNESVVSNFQLISSMWVRKHETRLISIESQPKKIDVVVVVVIDVIIVVHIVVVVIPVVDPRNLLLKLG